MKPINPLGQRHGIGWGGWYCQCCNPWARFNRKGRSMKAIYRRLIRRTNKWYDRITLLKEYDNEA